MTLTVGSLFSGIGGFDLGLEQAGMSVKWQVEVDPQCRRVLKAHYPTPEVFNDVRTVGTKHFDRVDLICGGFPCQDLSVAGKRSGLDGERSGLWFEFRRVVSELRPAWVLIENVPGLLSSNDGQDMATVLRGLEELGYGWAYRVLNSQHFGVAQRRRRVFIVGHLGGTGAAEVLFDAASLQRHPPTSGEARARIAEGTLSRALSRVGGGDDPGANKGAPIVTHTLTAPDTNAKPIDGKRQDGSRQDRIPIVTHPLTQRYDSSEDGSGRGLPLVAARNSGKGFWMEDDITGPMAARQYKGETQIVAFNLYPRSGQGAELQATETTKANALDGTALAAQTDRGTRVVSFTSKDYGADATDDIAPTLRAGGFDKSHANGGVGPAIAFAENQRAELRMIDISAQLTSGGGKPGQGYPAALDGNRPRRLTPRECERLQGFPDNWTLVDKLADGPRYRMLGNAVTVPVARWIGERILNVKR